MDPDGNLAYYNAGYPLSIYALWELTGKSLIAIRLYNITLGCVWVTSFTVWNSAASLRLSLRRGRRRALSGHLSR